MASSAIQRNVFTGQWETHIGVVEIVTIYVDSVVTSQAVSAISLQMRLHEISLDLLVASGTNGLVKLGIPASVTSAAYKRRTIRLFLVGGESISECIVFQIDF